MAEPDKSDDTDAFLRKADRRVDFIDRINELGAQDIIVFIIAPNRMTDGDQEDFIRTLKISKNQS